MASALERVNAAWATRTTGEVEQRFNIDGWVSDYLLPANQVTFGGNTYPFGLNQTFLGTRTKEISSTLPGYLAALRMCPPAFAAQMVRALVLSQARFIFRNTRRSARNPGRLFGTQALAPLETPWPNGTTGELLARMEWHAGLAGNAYVTNRQAGRLRVLRPDWVVIVYGSQQEPDDAAHALDGEILGYAYCNGGIAQGRNRVTTLLPDEVSHWSPLPDPEGAGIGMSWITPAIREIQGDRAATDHKLQFFANGATPNLVVKGVTAATKEQFDEIVDAMEGKHAGLRNAYRTLYLAAGADASIVGSNLKDLDLKSVNGSAETRISMLSRVHPTILGASEGLSGSSLNAGNFSSARRMWADSWIYPTLQDVAAALAPLIRVPADAELWTTTADMPILREDAKDAAEIMQIKATTANTLVTAGYTKASIAAAIEAQDMSLLVDSGLVSVQLQPPGAAATGAPVLPEAGGAGGPKAPALPPATRSSTDDEDDTEPDEATFALIAALAWFDDEEPDATRDATFESKHHRGPGGKFASMVDRLVNAIAEHQKSGGKGEHPFKDFNREQLRRAAVKRGISLKRGEDRDSIAEKLLADLDRGGKAPTPELPKKTAPRHKPAAEPAGPAIEVAKSLKDLSAVQLTRGEYLTPAGRAALDALGPAGHPRIAAIPDTEGKIREAYRMLAMPGGGSDAYVSFADLRKLIGDQASRSDVDATLRAMYAMPDVHITAQSYNRGNAATRIPASVRIGDQEQNMIAIADPTMARPSQFGALAMAEELHARKTGSSTDPMMALLSDAELQAEVDRRAAKDPMVAKDLAKLLADLGGATAKKERGHAKAPAAKKATTRATAQRRFNPDEPRIPGGPHGGEWGHPGGLVHDALKLAGRIDLDSGESLMSSRQLDFNQGAAKLAVTNRGVRLGLGGNAFAGDPWRAANKGLTVKLSGQQARDVADRLDAAAKRAKGDADIADKLWARAEATTGTAQHAAALKAAQDAVEGFMQPSGTVVGEWGTVHIGYAVHDTGYDVVAAVRPGNAPADWDLENAVGDDAGLRMDPAEATKLARTLRTVGG